MKKLIGPTMGLVALALGGLLAATATATAHAKTPSTVVPIENGVTKVSLDGVDVTVLRAFRENYNAHSFDVVSFYTGSLVDKKQQLGIVPIFSKDGEEVHEITIGGGADCNLTDFRLVKGTGKRPARLVVAKRDMGETYADDETVRFTVYEMKRNDDPESDMDPPVSFQEKLRINSKHKYCDVNDAFDKELHLGTAGGGRR